MPKRPVREIRKKPKRLDPQTALFIKQGLVGLALFTIIGFLGLGLWYGTRVESLTLTEIEVIGGETVIHDDVLEKVDTALEGHYFSIVPHRFAWWYPHDKVVDSIKEIERIHNVRVEKESGTKLQVVFDEFIPHALWCSEEDEQDCLFLDHTGYAFTKAPALRGEVFVRYYSLARAPERTQNVAPRETVDIVEDYIESLQEELGLYVVAVELDLAGDAFFTLSGGGEIKLGLSDDVERITDNLRVILESADFDHIEPGNFQYIDLRFGNKIFVNEEKEALIATTTASSTEVIEE